MKKVNPADILISPLHGEIYRYNNYGGQEVYLIGKTCGYA